MSNLLQNTPFWWHFFVARASMRVLSLLSPSLSHITYSHTHARCCQGDEVCWQCYYFTDSPPPNLLLQLITKFLSGYSAATLKFLNFIFSADLAFKTDLSVTGNKATAIVVFSALKSHFSSVYPWLEFCFVSFSSFTWNKLFLDLEWMIY